MKKYLSIKYSPLAFNIGTLLLRAGLGLLMVQKGYGKLVGFSGMQEQFMNFLGLGSTVSLGLTVFAEFFCSLLVIFGLFTRLALIPLIITMLVAANVHNWEIYGDGQLATIYLIGFSTLLLLGPGKFSLDGLMKGGR